MYDSTAHQYLDAIGIQVWAARDNPLVEQLPEADWVVVLGTEPLSPKAHRLYHNILFAFNIDKARVYETKQIKPNTLTQIERIAPNAILVFGKHDIAGGIELPDLEQMLTDPRLKAESFKKLAAEYAEKHGSAQS